MGDSVWEGADPIESDLARPETVDVIVQRTAWHSIETVPKDAIRSLLSGEEVTWIGWLDEDGEDHFEWFETNPRIRTYEEGE